MTRNALRSGWRSASLTTLGVGVGSIVWAAASLLGIGVILESSALAFTAVKLAGVAYLAYLGLRMLIGSFRSPAAASAATPTQPRTPMRAGAAFGQGVLGNLLNPKAGAIFVTLLPQFISLGDSPVRLGLMLVAFEAVLLAWLNLYGYAVVRAGHSRLGTALRRGLERVTGAVLVGLGVRLAFERG